MFKIQLANNEYYASKRGRVQHFMSIDKANAKIVKLGEIAAGATVLECKARTLAVKTDEIVPETKVEKVSKKKSAAKSKKTEGATDAKVASSKSKKKNKK